MRRVLLVYAVALCVLGLGSYFLAGRQSPTALIPAGFGVLALGCYFLAATKRALAMHLAAVLALLGTAGSVTGIKGVATMLTGGTVARPLAASAQSAMFVLSLAFLIFAVRSFIAARRSAEPGA